MTAILAGSVLILAVFVGLSVFIADAMGWRTTLLIWAASLGITAVVAAGSYLISSGVNSL